MTESNTMDIFQRLSLVADVIAAGDTTDGLQHAIYVATQNLDALTYSSLEERSALLHLALLMPDGHESSDVVAKICEADSLFQQNSYEQNKFEPQLLSHLKVLRTAAASGQIAPDMLTPVFANPKTTIERLVAMHALRLTTHTPSSRTQAIRDELPKWRQELLDSAQHQKDEFSKRKPIPTRSAKGIDNSAEAATSTPTLRGNPIKRTQP